ncbi:MAG: nucleotidyltransferase domain-containing protein [Nitrospirota bacterium]
MAAILQQGYKMNSFKTYSLLTDEKQKITHLVKAELKKHNEIVFAYIYGSFVDPEMPFFRDIDIGIYLKDYKDTEQLKYEIELSLELEKCLHYKYPVDLRVINGSNILFMHNVVQGELLFISDEDLWTDFIVYIGKLYGDSGLRFLHYMKEAVTS